MSELMKDSLLKHKEHIRTLVWYKRYRELAETLKDSKIKNPVKALKAVHNMIDNSHGYGYHHISVSAYDSLKQVVEDMGWVWS